MKKLISLLLAMAMLCSFALAEVYEITSAPFTLDMPAEIPFYELDEAEIEHNEGIVMAFGDDDSSILLNIYIDDGSLTLADYEAYFLEDIPEVTVSLDYITVNGIDMLRWIGSEGDENWAYYYVYENDTLYTFCFSFTAEGSSEQTDSIINTLTRK